MTASTTLSSPVSRRSLIKYAFGATAAVALGGIALTSDASARSGGGYRATTALNFRADASTSSQVLAVIPQGGTVGYLGERKNGFLAVSYQGMSGWAYEDFLAADNGDGAAVFYTTAAVNLRAKPSTSSKVLAVVPAGVGVLDYDFVMSNGFRGVDYNGTVGWIFDEYLTS